jgi:hypothetical protein
MSRKNRKWVGNFQVISTPISHPNPAFPTHFLFLVRCDLDTLIVGVYTRHDEPFP